MRHSDKRKPRPLPLQSGVNKPDPLTRGELAAREEIRLAVQALDDMKFYLEMMMPAAKLRLN